MSAAVDAWIESMIATCLPTAPPVTAAVHQLVDALVFLSSDRAGTVFGMALEPSKLADAGALRASAVRALGAWVERYAEAGDVRGCEVVFDAAARRGVLLPLEPPKAIAAAQEARRSARSALAACGTPRSALAAQDPKLAAAIRELAGDLDRVSVAKSAKLVFPAEAGLAFADFDWADDDWSELPAGFFDPCFLVLGGAGEVLLGLYLHGPALARGAAPVVTYGAAPGRALTWVAESLTHFEEVIDAHFRNKGKHRGPAIAAARGALDPEIARAIEQVASGGDDERTLVRTSMRADDLQERLGAVASLERIYTARGDGFAAASLAAQVALRALR